MTSSRGAGPSGAPPPGAEEVFRNDYFTVLVDEPQRIVYSVRSGRPFDSIEQLDARFQELCRVLDTFDRPRYALLADVRAAPGRNDLAFEEVMKPIRPRWMGGFRRVGVFVQSVVGALQVKRYARQDGIERLITSDEAEIMRHLTQG